MADWRRPDARRLVNGVGEDDDMSISPILHHEVLDQLELPHADSDRWWISTVSSGSIAAKSTTQVTSGFLHEPAWSTSLDHLVGQSEERGRHCKSE
jgi:hypothetical protein